MFDCSQHKIFSSYLLLMMQKNNIFWYTNAFCFVTGELLILLANSYPSPGAVQIVDLTSNKKCRPIANYPTHTFYSAGGLVNGKPLICGGYSIGPTAACYQYDFSTNWWKEFAYLDSKEKGHASVQVPSGLWFSGGYLKGWKTKFVYANGSVFAGPNLPEKRVNHCMVNLKDGRIMIIGGYPTYKDVLIYHLSNKSFAQGPSLQVDRVSHACTLFRSPMHGNREVVLVGCGYREGGTRSVEVLDFKKPGAVWEQSKFRQIFISIISLFPTKILHLREKKNSWKFFLKVFF